MGARAMGSGPLCDEQCRGVRINLMDVTLHADAIHLANDVVEAEAALALLLKADWSYAQGAYGAVRLQVYEDNEPARRLYASRGFIEEGVMRDEVLLADRWVHLVGMSVDTYGDGA